MLPFRYLPALLVLPLSACAVAEGEPVNLTWSTVQIPCTADDAAVEWDLPDPAPVTVLVREGADNRIGYNQQFLAEDGVAFIVCGADVTLTYAQVIE